MAIVSSKLLTAEEFFEFVSQPEHQDQFFELDHGEIIEMPPPGKFHGFVCGNVAGVLGNFAQVRCKGYVCTNDAGVIVERDPDTVRGPDVTFYEDAQNAATMERQFAVVPPLLAVEVLSPHDRPNKLVHRVTQLLQRGVRCVWLVDPDSRDVTVHQSGREPVLLDDTLELDGGEVLPGFHCRVAEFFALPGA